MTKAEFEFNKSLCQQEIAEAMEAFKAGNMAKAKRPLQKALDQEHRNAIGLLLTGLQRWVDQWKFEEAPKP